MSYGGGDSLPEWVRRLNRLMEEKLECEVYFLHQKRHPNGFAEYRNGGHIIYIVGDIERFDKQIYLDILLHEAGHVRYNRHQMTKGFTYDEIVKRTQEKLSRFDAMLQQNLITDKEYGRLYAAIEEEWESNKEKEKILSELQVYLLDLLGKWTGW